ILSAGADKISINSAAVSNPNLIEEGAKLFGSQCIVVAVDVKKEKGKWKVYTHGGRTRTKWDALEWLAEVESLGAGEILLTSIDRDGTKTGFDIELYRAVSETVGIPIIASGGGGTVDDFIDLFKETEVTGALAASIFHYNEISIGTLKWRLKEEGIPIRLEELK
ncbi:MAG: imidazole glycerol phosphate synthase cyclase subunit, partial [Methanobacteriota archaeon]